MSRLINKWNDEIRNQAISIIRNLTTENGLSFDELGVLSSFLLIERTENSKLAHYEDLEDEGLLTIIDNETFQRDDLDRCTYRNCNKCDKYRQELQRYKDLEDDGRLMELPCAEGDTVYLISSQYSECSKYQERFNDCNCQGCEDECDSYKDYFIHVNKNISAEWIVRAMRLNRFGENVFLTQEAAEAKLAEMEGAE